MKNDCNTRKLYFIMAYPYSIPVYAFDPEGALLSYKKSHPKDKREYVYTGAYRRWVINEKRNETKK